MKTKRKLIAGLSAAAVALGCISSTSFADSADELNSFEATSDNVKILGRAKYIGSADALWFGLTGAGVEFDFTGTTAVLNISADSAASSDSSPARIAIYADGEIYSDTTTLISPKDYEVDFDERGIHTVRLIKLSECLNGTIRLNEIRTDSETIAPTESKSRKIEFIGDSITCGYGVDAASGTFSTKTEDGSKTYAYKTAQKLDADYSMVCFSGYGVISGYSNNGNRSASRCMPDYYGKLGNSWGTFDDGKRIRKEEWDFAGFTPDLVVVNLGSNDAAYIRSIKDDDVRESEKKAFTETYVAFIGQIREANPDAEILCTLGICGQDLCPQVETAVRSYRNTTGDVHVNYLRFNVHNKRKNGAGIDGHPAPQSHIDAAYELLDAIEELYGWQGSPDICIDIPAIEPETDGDVSVNIGTSKALKVKVIPAAAEEITYTVSDKSVAAFGSSDTVRVTSNADGEASAKITGKKAGSTNVTVTTSDGRKTAFKVTVEKTSLEKANVKLSAKKKTYTGKAIMPAVTVTLDGKTLAKDTDYTVAYKNNVMCGKAAVAVSGKGDYVGSKSGTFIIRPKRVAVKKLTSPKSGQIRLTWKKSAGGVTGYQVQIAADKGFGKGRKSYNVKASSASKTITELKKGKKYFARVRAYKTVGKTKYYGAYSAVKKATVK